MASRGTPMRTMRIPDRVWEKAHRIAELNDTTVTAIVAGYLNGLTSKSKLRPSQIRVGGPTPVERNNVRRARAGRPNDDMKGARQRTPTTPTIKPEDCEHKNPKVMTFGTFCTNCQTRIA